MAAVGPRRGGAGLGGRPDHQEGLCRAVANVNAVLGARLAGVRQRRETAAALKREVRGRYEAAVARGNVAALSELTLLLWLLDMTELGMRLYLQYLQACLCQDGVRDSRLRYPRQGCARRRPDRRVPQEDVMSCMAIHGRDEERRNREARNRSIPARLTRIYNAVSRFEFLA